MILDRIASMFSSGILSKYSLTGGGKKSSLHTLSPGRCKKTMRPVLVKEYTREGVEVERKLDTLYRARPLAEILRELRSPFIAATLEVESTGARRVEILEAVSLRTFRELASEGGLSPRVLLEVAGRVAKGLSYLHSRGLVHRGLTPEAIIVGPETDARILDLSLIMDSERLKYASTMTGVTRYSAPEIIRRAPVDHRSDVFSLGAILYECICGAPLFPNTSAFEKLLRVMNSQPVGVRERNPDAGAQLETVIMKAVSRDPDERYPDVEAMMGELEKAPLPGKLGPHAPAFAA